MSNASVKSKSDFDDIVGAEDDIESRRRKLENNIYKVVIVLCVMGLASAGMTSQTLQSIVSWFSPSGGHNATIVAYRATSGNNLTFNSTQERPTFNNTFVRFNVTYADEDLSDWHTFYVCNGSSGNYSFDMVPSDIMRYNFSCGGRLMMCNYSKFFTTDNPQYCDYNIVGAGNQTQNYSVFVIDSAKKVGHVSGSWAGDRPPSIINIFLSKL
jgi:hypothetical protein